MPEATSSEFKSVFKRLRSILQKHAGRLSVADDSAHRYCLDGAAGPAAVRAWGGKLKRPRIPVAWVEIGRSYVSYHLMAMDGSPQMRAGMSKELLARMQGKTCFNFKTEDDALFKELEQLTMRGLTAFKEAGFLSDE